MSQLYVAGTALPSQVLTGTTFSAGTNYNAAGTMPNNGSLNYTPGVAALTIPLGYTSGGTIAGDAKLLAANIIAGKSIFGVAGTANRFVKGTVTSDASGNVTVSGLGFTPLYIMVLSQLTQANGGYSATIVYMSTDKYQTFPFSGVRTDYDYVYYTGNGGSVIGSNLDGTNSYVNGTGFKLKLGANSIACTYIAIG
ncbi:hypothetical protein [Tumebacillus permanentifrigoris]|uniref:Uncharacterized protein n=1 Tax=Tumebacillus permanentifrigoris TaxID=378543 RepID=A0A316DER1_9BACL|nr:hypothetical protein [Tumebacillus permanentifrigoris]PWK16052.1 hypothetical protein C7459_102299 [Tumebacillus permanentifrigoris]